MDGELVVSNWQKLYYIATWILAAVAIAGFILSILTSRQVTKTLDGIQHSLAAQLEPTIGFVGFRWVGEKELSCENPPTGIIFDLKNTSTVPVQLSGGVTKFFYGELELKESTQTLGGGSEIILAPAEVTQNGTVQKELFQKYLSQPKSVMEDPFVRIHHEVDFRRLNDQKKYRYKTIWAIGFDCRSPGVQRAHREIETIELVTGD